MLGHQRGEPLSDVHPDEVRKQHALISAFLCPQQYHVVIVWLRGKKGSFDDGSLSEDIH